jgi:hypothetical protein
MVKPFFYNTKKERIKVAKIEEKENFNKLDFFRFFFALETFKIKGKNKTG